MSRTGLHRPRLSRTAFRRPAPGTRLSPTPFPFTVLHPNTHYKRCPKAQRLGLRSDQSLSRPLQGRFPDKSRHALSMSCQVRAPLSGRNGFAPSGDAKEHGVMLLHRAIAPFLDFPGIHLAGQSEQSEVARLKTNRPFMDSTVVTTGKFRSTNAGHGSSLSPLGVLEHFQWARLPQSGIFSCLVHILSEVWGCDSTVVTIGKFRSMNGGHGSMLSPLGVLERFRWTRLPQSENISRLVHILSEVWGCRRIDAGVDRPRGRTPRIGTGVADILRKPSGTFHPLPLPLSLRPDSYTVTPAPDLESTPRAESRGGVLPPLPRGERAGVRVIPSPACGIVITNQHPSHCHSDAPRGIWGGAPSPLPSTKLEGSACPEPLEGERGTKGVSVPFLLLRLRRPSLSSPTPVKNPSFPPPVLKLEGAVGAGAPTAPSVFPSPSPLKALRERGIKGVRVPSVFLKQSKPCLKPQNNQKLAHLPCPQRHAKSPEIPLGIVQSNQLRVQSTFNQNPTPTTGQRPRIPPAYRRSQPLAPPPPNM